MRPAVFLDRDGTIIEHVHHLCDPGDVRLIHQAPAAIRALRQAGYVCVVVTNQSVIGRGGLTVAGLEEIHRVMLASLAEHGTTLDAIYYCPLTPRTDDPTLVDHPERKPGPMMLLRAAADLALDLRRSWMIGDSLSDVLAGRNAGCCATILVRTGQGHLVAADHDAIDYVATDLGQAAELILERIPAKPGSQSGQPFPDR